MTAGQYAALLEQAGESDEAALLRGEIQFLQNEPVYALSTLRTIKAEGTDLHLDAVYLSGRCLLSMRQFREAERAFQFVLDSRPNHLDSRRGLASIYYDLGNFDQAIAMLLEVEEKDPADARAPRLVALMYKDLDQFDEAIPHYESSLRRAPEQANAAEVRHEYSECLLKKWRASDVLRVLDSDNSPIATGLKSQALVMEGKPEEATALLDKALKAHDDESLLRRLRAERFKDAGDPGAAARLLEKIVAAEPHDFVSRDLLAKCYSSMGKPKQAAEQLEKVKSSQDLVHEVNVKMLEAMKKPWDPKVRYQLAELCDTMGRPKLAQMRRNAAEACPDYQ